MHIYFESSDEEEEEPSIHFCSKCTQYKLVKEFGKKSAHPSGLFPHCKKCRSKKRNSIEEKEKRSKREKGYLKNPIKKKRKYTQGALSQFIRGNKNYISKGEKLVGCSLTEYRAYIQSKWKPGMSWANYGRGKGKWHVGHKVPYEAIVGINTECITWYRNVLPKWSNELNPPTTVKDKKDLLRRFHSFKHGHTTFGRLW